MEWSERKRREARRGGRARRRSCLSPFVHFCLCFFAHFFFAEELLGVFCAHACVVGSAGVMFSSPLVLGRTCVQFNVVRRICPGVVSRVLGGRCVAPQYLVPCAPWRDRHVGVLFIGGHDTDAGVCSYILVSLHRILVASGDAPPPPGRYLAPADGRSLWFSGPPFRWRCNPRRTRVAGPRY